MNHIASNLLKLDNVNKIDIHFKWILISEDMDDNKFLDHAKSSGATYLVGNDKHFA